MVMGGAATSTKEEDTSNGTFSHLDGHGGKCWPLVEASPGR